MAFKAGDACLLGAYAVSVDNIPEDFSVQQHRCETLKCRMQFIQLYRYFLTFGKRVTDFSVQVSGVPTISFKVFEP
jgi:hypothetical protein